MFNPENILETVRARKARVLSMAEHAIADSCERCMSNVTDELFTIRAAIALVGTMTGGEGPVQEEADKLYREFRDIVLPLIDYFNNGAPREACLANLRERARAHSDEQSESDDPVLVDKAPNGMVLVLTTVVEA